MHNVFPKCCVLTENNTMEKFQICITSVTHLQHKLRNSSRYIPNAVQFWTQADKHNLTLQYCFMLEANRRQTVHEATGLTSEREAPCDLGGHETGPLAGLKAHKVFWTVTKALPSDEHANILQDVTFEALIVVNVKTTSSEMRHRVVSFWNVVSFLPNYKKSHPGRQYYSCLWIWTSSSCFVNQASAIPIHTKMQHSNLCTFIFIPSRYIFRSITLTIIRHRQNTRTKGKMLQRRCITLKNE